MWKYKDGSLIILHQVNVSLKFLYCVIKVKMWIGVMIKCFATAMETRVKFSCCRFSQLSWPRIEKMKDLADRKVKVWIKEANKEKKESISLPRVCMFH